MYERSKQLKIVIACFALYNYLLDRGHIGGSRSNSHGQADADYDVSDRVSANTSQETTVVRDKIATGVSLMYSQQLAVLVKLSLFSFRIWWVCTNY
jgi:hypothetical protein